MNTREQFYKVLIKEYEKRNLKYGQVLRENIAQDLYAIRLNLQRYSIEEGNSAGLEETRNMVTETISKVQYLSNVLLNVVLRDFGLKRALEDHFLNINSNNEVIVDNKINSLDFSCQLLIFHMVRYVITAIITDDLPFFGIYLHVEGDDLHLEILGVNSNNLNKLKQTNSKKIKKLQDRVNLLEGTLAFNTDPQEHKIVVIVKLN
jgi:signal transduction histidine kinase